MQAIHATLQTWVRCNPARMQSLLGSKFGMF